MKNHFHSPAARGSWLALLLGAIFFTAPLLAQPVTTEWANKSFAELKSAAERGDPVGMRMLASAYLKGEEVPQNAPEAARWLFKAAEKKDVLAQYVLGILYDQGKGVPQDYTEAVKWYRLAAEAGMPDAQFNMGACYKQGLGVQKDLHEAMLWFGRAADQNDPQAQYQVGLANLNGTGVERNPTLAAKWFRAAAYQGDMNSQNTLAMLYQTGIGVTKSPEDAAKWFRKAAEQSSSLAQYQTGIAYLAGDGVARDIKEGAVWLQKAAAQGHVEAQKQLNLIANNGGPSLLSEPASNAVTRAVPAMPAPITNASVAAVSAPKIEPPPFFSSPANRDLPPAAALTNKDDPSAIPTKTDVTANVPKPETTSSFFAPPIKEVSAPTTPTPARELPPMTAISTPTLPTPSASITPPKDDTAATIDPIPALASRTQSRDVENERPTKMERQMQMERQSPADRAPSSELVGPTTLAMMTLGTAVVMMLLLGYMVVFFKARILSLENEIKKTQFELSKANVNLTAMLHQVEALQLSEHTGARLPERNPTALSRKELAAETSETAFRARRSV